MMRAALLLALPLVLPLALHAQRPLRIEDYYRIRTPGAPQLSPDGKWVAFTVASRDEATNTEPAEVWLASSDGAMAAHRLSSASTNATAPLRCRKPFRRCNGCNFGTGRFGRDNRLGTANDRVR